MAHAIQIELPPWPHVDNGPAKVEVAPGRWLFGRLVGKNWVLTPKGRILYAEAKDIHKGGSK